MKTLKVTLIALFIVSSFAACKKDKTEPVVVPLEGKWTGKFSYPGSEKDFNLTINQDASKTIELKSIDGTLSGTWLLSDNIFTASFPDANLKIKGTFDSTTGKITGTVGVAPNDSGLGTWLATKDK